MQVLPDEFSKKVDTYLEKKAKAKKTLRQTKEAKKSREEFNVYTQARLVSYKLLNDRLKVVEKKIDKILELVSIVR